MTADTKDWGSLPPKVADVQVVVYGNRTWAMTEVVEQVIRSWPLDDRRRIVADAVREFETALTAALLRDGE